MGVTQAQIAKLAGVSRGTVDRVINRRGHVDPAVEAKSDKLQKNWATNATGPAACWCAPNAPGSWA